MKLITRKKLESFKNWLMNQGVEILKTTNEYELLRFECAHGVGVIYTGKKGISFSGQIVADAWDSFSSSKPWDGRGKRVERGPAARKKFLLIKRDGLRCFYCWGEFDPNELTVEHLVSLNLGGPDRTENMVLSCESCNREAGSRAVIDKVFLREQKRPASIDKKSIS